MASLKETSENYVSQKIKNIADLDIVSISEEIFQETGTDLNGKDFTYKYMVILTEKYRVPNSVFEAIKAILKENPQVTHIKVLKEGTALNTRYTVVQKAINTEVPVKEVSTQVV